MQQYLEAQKGAIFKGHAWALNLILLHLPFLPHCFNISTFQLTLLALLWGIMGDKYHGLPCGQTATGRQPVRGSIPQHVWTSEEGWEATTKLSTSKTSLYIASRELNVVPMHRTDSPSIGQIDLADQKAFMKILLQYFWEKVWTTTTKDPDNNHNYYLLIYLIPSLSSKELRLAYMALFSLPFPPKNSVRWVRLRKCDQPKVILCLPEALLQLYNVSQLPWASDTKGAVMQIFQNYCRRRNVRT